MVEATELSKQVVGSIARITVPTVDPATSIIDIAQIMTEQNIGAVIVANQVEVLGIVTERDIIERIADTKQSVSGLAAQDIMTSPVITIDYERSIEDAIKILKENNIRRLVVVKGKRVLGLVTERRLLLANLAGQKPNLEQ
jgi:CBS domain-containing protein